MNYEERIATLTHVKAAATLRFLERQGCRRQEEMRLLCERAAETAPERDTALWQRRLDVYRAGRIIRWKNFATEFIPLDEDPEMVAEIEQVVQEEFGKE